MAITASAIGPILGSIIFPPGQFNAKTRLGSEAGSKKDSLNAMQFARQPTEISRIFITFRGLAGIGNQARGACWRRL
jgi:hypothetical protein